jgi:prephenate dehydrogenase
LIGEFLVCIAKIGADIETIDVAEHDRICGWISHLPQMLSTGLAAALVEEFGEDASLLEAGGRALREMTRISASPYGIWRDVVLTNKQNVREALLKLEQKLAHIRENLDTRGLEEEFERAHKLKKVSPGKHGGAGN